MMMMFIGYYIRWRLKMMFTITLVLMILLLYSQYLVSRVITHVTLRKTDPGNSYPWTCARSPVKQYWYVYVLILFCILQHPPQNFRRGQEPGNPKEEEESKLTLRLQTRRK